MTELLLWLISLIVGGETERTLVETHLRMDTVSEIVFTEVASRGLGDDMRVSCSTPLGSAGRADGEDVLRLQAGADVVVQCSLFRNAGGFDSSIKVIPSFYATVGVSLSPDGTVETVVGVVPVSVDVPSPHGFLE